MTRAANKTTKMGNCNASKGCNARPDRRAKTDNTKWTALNQHRVARTDYGEFYHITTMDLPQIYFQDQLQARKLNIHNKRIIKHNKTVIKRVQRDLNKDFMMQYQAYCQSLRPTPETMTADQLRLGIQTGEFDLTGPKPMSIQEYYNFLKHSAEYRRQQQYGEFAQESTFGQAPRQQSVGTERNASRSGSTSRAGSYVVHPAITVKSAPTEKFVRFNQAAKSMSSRAATEGANAREANFPIILQQYRAAKQHQSSPQFHSPPPSAPLHPFSRNNNNSNEIDGATLPPTNLGTYWTSHDPMLIQEHDLACDQEVNEISNSGGMCHYLSEFGEEDISLEAVNTSLQKKVFKQDPKLKKAAKGFKIANRPIPIAKFQLRRNTIAQPQGLVRSAPPSTFVDNTLCVPRRSAANNRLLPLARRRQSAFPAVLAKSSPFKSPRKLSMVLERKKSKLMHVFPEANELAEEEKRETKRKIKMKEKLLELLKDQELLDALRSGGPIDLDKLNLFTKGDQSEGESIGGKSMSSYGDTGGGGDGQSALDDNSNAYAYAGLLGVQTDPDSETSSMDSHDGMLGSLPELDGGFTNITDSSDTGGIGGNARHSESESDRPEDDFHFEYDPERYNSDNSDDNDGFYDDRHDDQYYGDEDDDGLTDELDDQYDDEYYVNDRYDQDDSATNSGGDISAYE